MKLKPRDYNRAMTVSWATVGLPSLAVVCKMTDASVIAAGLLSVPWLLMFGGLFSLFVKEIPYDDSDHATR